MTVQHLDYSRLTATPELLHDFERTLKILIAGEVGSGVNPSKVLLALQAGSVRVKATVPGLEGPVAERASSALGQTPSFPGKLAESIANVRGIEAASTGTIAVTDVAASSSGADGGGSPLVLVACLAAAVVALLLILVLFFLRRPEPGHEGVSALKLDDGSEGAGAPLDPTGVGVCRTISPGAQASPRSAGRPSPRKGPLPKLNTTPSGMLPPNSRDGGTPHSSQGTTPRQGSGKSRAKAMAKFAASSRLPMHGGPSPMVAPVHHATGESRSSSRSSHARGGDIIDPTNPSAPARPADWPAQRRTVPRLGMPRPGSGGSTSVAPPARQVPGRGASAPSRSAGSGDEDCDFLALAAEMGLAEDDPRESHAGNNFEV